MARKRTIVLGMLAALGLLSLAGPAWTQDSAEDAAVPASAHVTEISTQDPLEAHHPSYLRKQDEMDAARQRLRDEGGKVLVVTRTARGRTIPFPQITVHQGG